MIDNTNEIEIKTRVKTSVGKVQKTKLVDILIKKVAVLRHDGNENSQERIKSIT